MGRRTSVRAVDVTSPPMTTIASGFWISEPGPVANSSGTRPSAAMLAVINTGRSRRVAPSKTALLAGRPTASVRPAASKGLGGSNRQQDVAPRRPRRGAPVNERSVGPSRVGGRTTRGASMRYFVGLDWASREHAICAVNQEGAIKARFTVEHSAAGMAVGPGAGVRRCDGN